jgi:predicted deacylase
MLLSAHQLIGALLAGTVITLAQVVTEGGEPPPGAPAPVAENVDLSEPLHRDPALAEQTPPDAKVPDAPAPAADPTAPATSPAPEQPPAPRAALDLLGEHVLPGTSARLVWSPDQSFEGIAVPTAVLVVHGERNGPTVCLTAALHGDELNGIEIVRRVLYDLDPKQLAGTVIGVPIVNLHGFRRNSRYLPDRRDLNRFFPGAAHGSSASRIAHSFFEQVVRRCNALVDIHTGSFQRTNLPQLRADMKVPAVAGLTSGFTATSVLHSPGEPGTLRRAAVEVGIPAVTLETGEPGRLQQSKIEHGTQGITGLFDHLGMLPRTSARPAPEPVYYESVWVRADRGGLLFGEVSLGQRVRSGELLATVTDPITNVRSELRAPQDGRVLGMALNQVVMPGFAAFRIGIPTTESDLASPAAAAPDAMAPADPNAPAPAPAPAEGSAPPPDEENS